MQPYPAHASAVSISNVTLEAPNSTDETIKVQFDITWQYSWKNNVNHDAVWVFVKYYSTNSGSTWKHAQMKYPGINPDGFSRGKGDALDLIVPDTLTGCIIQRAENGSGPVQTTDVELLWHWGADSNLDSNETAKVKVLAVEMVYIPESSFYLGDGDGSNESTYALHQTDNTTVQIDSTLKSGINVDTNTSLDDAQLENPGIGIDGDGGIDWDNSGTIDNQFFPTGYTAFYLMKYEISQGQYKDFLNMLTYTEQSYRCSAITQGRYMSSDDLQTTPQNLNGICVQTAGNPSPGVYAMDLNNDTNYNDPVDGENKACNYLSWQDLCAYADWAGLRPMTELEFEKACRGPNSAVYGEYAWGTTQIFPLLNVLPADGVPDEYANEFGFGTCHHQGSPQGPVRGGFASYTGGIYQPDRVISGGGYYGNMELSGNVSEQCVTVGNSTGRGFKGTHGDGTLETASGYEGNATNSDWPGYASGQGVSGATGAGLRGRDWNAGTPGCRTSDRENAAVGAGSNSEFFGGRLALTAPVQPD